MISKNNREQVVVVLDRSIGSQWPGSDRRSSRQSVYRERNGHLIGLRSSKQTFLEATLMDDSVQCWSNFRIEYLNIWCFSSSDRTRRFWIIQWYKHLHFFDPLHCIASLRNCEQVRTSILNLLFQQARSCWDWELVKMNIRNLQLLLFCSIILRESSLTRVEWFSGWRSWLTSRIQGCVLFLALSH